MILIIYFLDFDSFNRSMPNRIKLAINTIDLLMDKFKNVDESNVTISTDSLNDMNKEYQTFIFKKI